MAAITVGLIDFDEIVRGDLLDLTFDVQHDLDFTGKTIYSEVRKDMDTPIILKFKESDGSLVITTASSVLFSIQFYKSASDMDINTSKYQISVIFGTAPNYEDKQTFITGNFNVVEEITQKPTI
jgi:hypothetical protein